MNTITLPDGNEQEGYVAIAVFKSALKAASYAHAMCLEHKRSVRWDEYFCPHVGGKMAMGFAVWIATAEPKKPKPITHRGWTHVEVG